MTHLVQGISIVIVLILPSATWTEAPSSPSTQPAAAATATSAPGSNPIQSADAAVGSYSDRAAPLLPSGDSEEETLDVIADTLGLPANAAPTSSGAPAAATTAPSTTQSAQPKKGEWLIAPLPNYSPTFGWGVIGRAGYIFPLNPDDKVSPPSVVGAFGYYSQNDSWAAGMATRLFVDEDRYRITAALLHGELNYEFSGIGTAAGTSGQSVPLDQEMTGGIFETLFRIAPNFYLGPKYIGSKMNIHIDSDGSSVTVPRNEVNTTFSGLGLHAQWDTRDSQFYPRKGYLADVDITFHDPALGDDFAYQVYKLSYNRYVSLASNQVLALRAMGQFENGDVPFYALSQFGRGSDLRGYRVGQFQDKQMLAVQAEYRFEITKRVGAVAFVGIGEVVPSLSALTFENLLPSGGVGLRYVVAPENHVALRLDVAWGREGSQFYLTVGEAF